MFKLVSQLMSTRYEKYGERSAEANLIITLIIWGVEMSEYVSYLCLVVFSTIKFLSSFVLYRKSIRSYFVEAI